MRIQIVYVHTYVCHVHTYVCQVLHSMYIICHCIMYVCNFRVTNITIDEVDQPLISNVIEVRMYICICVWLLICVVRTSL